MSLSSSQLSLMFQGDVFVEEAPAIAEMADGWEAYISDMECGGSTITGAAVATGKSAFSGALVGMSSPGAGGASLIGAMTASWGAIVAIAPAAFPGAPLIGPGTPPPGISGGLGTLQPIFDANTAQGGTQAEAADALAAGLHPLNLGAFAPIVAGTLPIT